jgi:crotonobetainyl-CoA:carnitine CoA-transferase CaiB-like acyl-CoA transferase
VIKVEPPAGDPTRLYGPPYVGAPQPGVAYAPEDPRADPDYAGESGYYLSINRNKRGVRLDLRAPGGREVLGRLLGRSDVLIENFRVGAFSRLGFDDAELERINPRLVRLSITGYGATGPDRDRPGFDFIIQAVSGLMSITGAPDDEGGGPTKVGVAIADLTTGMLGAVSVLAALRARDGGSAPGRGGGGRGGRGSGEGQRIDLSLLESTIAWLINQAANHLVGDVLPGRMGNRHPNITPYETYRTADGEIAVAVGSERQWVRFCGALGIADSAELAGLAADVRFATNADRVRNREVLRAILGGAIARRSTGEWLAALTAAEVPAGQVRDLAQAFADPQVLARDMVVSVDHPTAGTIRLPGIPYKLAATPGSIRRPPPLFGEHTNEVLAELGYSASEVAALHDAGVV